MLTAIAAQLPAWLSTTGSTWPLKVGHIARVSRMDVLQTPAFSVRSGPSLALKRSWHIL